MRLGRGGRGGPPIPRRRRGEDGTPRRPHALPLRRGARARRGRSHSSAALPARRSSAVERVRFVASPSFVNSPYCRGIRMPLVLSGSPWKCSLCVVRKRSLAGSEWDWRRSPQLFFFAVARWLVMATDGFVVVYPSAVKCPTCGTCRGSCMKYWCAVWNSVFERADRGSRMSPAWPKRRCASTPFAAAGSNLSAGSGVFQWCTVWETLSFGGLAGLRRVWRSWPKRSSLKLWMRTPWL
mmetsp:Transcript_78331/g.219572  ORF Transcript_78331/g.219572 Transcript_78331/m.219572 type:complete len:238 (-) Transcript_78331:120-833(-)